MTKEQIIEHEKNAASIMWRRIGMNMNIMNYIENEDYDTYSLLLDWLKMERKLQDSYYESV